MGKGVSPSKADPATAMNSRPLFSFLLACAFACQLSSCRSVRVEHVAPEFKNSGLRGRTLALGEVLSAGADCDPTAAETAAAMHEAEIWLEEKRPATHVVDFASFGRLTGPLHIRFHGGEGLPLASLTRGQYAKAQAAGIHYVLFVELTGRDTRSGVGVREEQSTTTECDKDGKEETKTTTTRTQVAYATCWVTCRFYVVDVRSRQVVWQALSAACESAEKVGGPADNSFVPPPEIPLMPATSAAVRNLVPTVLRKLPK